MIIIIALFIVGIVLIVKGGDFFVDAASWIAEVSGIPKLIVGATVVSFATTLPELLVSVFAALQGKVDMAIGNAVGSVTANTGLILAFGLLFMPSVIKRKDYLLKSIWMLLAIVIITIASLTGGLGLLPSVLLISIFVAAMYENVYKALQALKEDKKAGVTEQKAPLAPKIVWMNIAKFVLGIAGIIIGADLLVDQGSKIALAMGIPERIIAVTVIAIGTSLPELVTTITAIVKKQASLSAGNIIGANIIDMTMILPVCAIIYGDSLPFAEKAASVDMPFCLMIAVIALIPTLVTKKFARWQGGLMLGIYGVYLLITCM